VPENNYAEPGSRFSSLPHRRCEFGDHEGSDHPNPYQIASSVIVIGLLANTCIEATSKFAAELGYHVTLIKDATAAFSMDRTHAAHELNGPTQAHEILTTAQLTAALCASRPTESVAHGGTK